MNIKNRFVSMIYLAGIFLAVLFITSAFTWYPDTSGAASLGAEYAKNTPTPTPKKGLLSRILTFRFSISSSNKVPPADVFKEIAYGGTGGGGGPNCEDRTAFEVDGTHVKADGSMSPIILGHPVSAFACGWKSGEQVTVRFIDPGGKLIETQQLRAQEAKTKKKMDYLVDYELYVPVDGPTGIYTIEFQGKSNRAVSKMKVVAPTGAQVVEQRNNQLFFYAFKPNEMVRVYAYKCGNSNCVFYGWGEYQVGDKGRLLLDIDPAYDYTVIGNKSGYVSGYDVRINACYGTPKTRMSVGKKGRVTFTTGQKVRVRNAPGTNSKVEETIPEGTTFSVVDGPMCKDKYIWWKIQLSDRTQGWVAEGESGNYFIEPYN